MHRVQIIQADITTLEVDAIVNAANQTLCGGGGVDGAIHRAAGPKLLEACRELGGCDTGWAKHTNGFDLPARYVIHAVGPVWHGGNHNEWRYWTRAFGACLSIARDLGARTMAFPAISCGAYRFPIPLAARTAMTGIADVLPGYGDLEQLTFAMFERDCEREFRRALTRFLK